MGSRYIDRHGEPKSLRGAWIDETHEVSTIDDDTGEDDPDVSTLDEPDEDV